MNPPQYIVTFREHGVNFLDLTEGRVAYAIGPLAAATRFDSEDAAYAAVVDYCLAAEYTEVIHAPTR